MASSTVSDTSFALQSSIQKFKQDLEAFAKRTVADVEQTKSLCKNSLAQKKGLRANDHPSLALVCLVSNGLCCICSTADTIPPHRDEEETHDQKGVTQA